MQPQRQAKTPLPRSLLPTFVVLARAQALLHQRARRRGVGVRPKLPAGRGGPQRGAARVQGECLHHHFGQLLAGVAGLAEAALAGAAFVKILIFSKDAGPAPASPPWTAACRRWKTCSSCGRWQGLFKVHVLIISQWFSGGQASHGLRQMLALVTMSCSGLGGSEIVSLQPKISQQPQVGCISSLQQGEMPAGVHAVVGAGRSENFED